MPSPKSFASSSATTKANKTSSIDNKDADEIAINQQYNSAWINARRNFKYLWNPNTTATTERPGRFRTRALLRTIRYVTQFIVWRLVRWAKYAAVASLVAAVSASAVGGFVSGVGWIVAPPSIGASILAFGVWRGGRFAAARLHRRWRETGMDKGEVARESRSDFSAVATGGARLEAGPNAMPW